MPEFLDAVIAGDGDAAERLRAASSIHNAAEVFVHRLQLRHSEAEGQRRQRRIER